MPRCYNLLSSSSTSSSSNSGGNNRLPFAQAQQVRENDGHMGMPYADEAVITRDPWASGTWEVWAPLQQHSLNITPVEAVTVRSRMLF